MNKINEQEALDIGRTQTNGKADYAAVAKVQDGYKITPLSQWGKESKPVAFTSDPTVDMKTPPLVQINTMPAAKYFSYAAELMKANPPHITDWSTLARLNRIGIEPGKSFDFDSASPAVKSALDRAVVDGLKLMQDKVPTMACVVNGWQMNTDTMGVYGNYSRSCRRARSRMARPRLPRGVSMRRSGISINPASRGHLRLAQASLPILLAILIAAPLWAADDEAEELAKKLQNPIASLISVPLQNNWDFGIGAANAMRYTLNVQPVIPFSLTTDWNLITRTIVPIVYAESPVVGGDNTFGLGDIVQSFFFSPKAPTKGGWIWGVGPVFLYPSATDEALGAEKWGAGPTAVVLRQDSGWTYGMLANQLWSFAGTSSRAEVNATFLQPFVAYTTKTYTTFGLNTESTYDWTNRQWTVPLNLTVSQLLKLGGQPIQFQLGGRYYLDRPTGGPDWGLRFTVTFLFPK